MTKTARFRLALLVALACPAPAPAQDSTLRRDPWLTAFSVGFPVANGEISVLLFTLGASFTRITPGRIAPDLSIGTMFLPMGMGVLPFGFRGGLALPMQPTANLYMVPFAGMSVMGIVGTRDVAGSGGFNAGLALVTSASVRAAITWHRMGESDRFILLEIGAGQIKP